MNKLFKDIKKYPKRSRFIRAIKQFFDFKTFKKDKRWWWFELRSSFERVFEYSPPFSWINDLKWWIVYRTTKRFHILNTGLKPGYYDSDRLMLHACFQILVDFVEKELPWSSWDELKKIPWYRSTRKYIKKNAERLAFIHLDWEMTLRMLHLDNGEDDLSSDLQIQHEGTQGWAAKEIKELYLWWKYDRKKEAKICYDTYAFEKQELFEQKNNFQLQRLVKIRGNLWT